LSPWPVVAIAKMSINTFFKEHSSKWNILHQNWPIGLVNLAILGRLRFALPQIFNQNNWVGNWRARLALWASLFFWAWRRTGFAKIPQYILTHSSHNCPINLTYLVGRVQLQAPRKIVV
jgi:hypothetical protein